MAAGISKAASYSDSAHSLSGCFLISPQCMRQGTLPGLGCRLCGACGVRGAVWPSQVSSTALVPNRRPVDLCQLEWKRAGLILKSLFVSHYKSKACEIETECSIWRVHFYQREKIGCTQRIQVISPAQNEDNWSKALWRSLKSSVSLSWMQTRAHMSKCTLSYHLSKFS